MFLFIKHSVVLRVLGIVCKGYICIFSQSLLLSAFLFFVNFYSLYISILHTLLFFVHFFSFVHVYALYISILCTFVFFLHFYSCTFLLFVQPFLMSCLVLYIFVVRILVLGV